MHGTFLTVFKRPPDAKNDYIEELAARWRTYPEALHPFDRKLHRPSAINPIPRWEKVDRIDPILHLRSTTLKSPGGEAQLTRLVSALHGEALDPAQPLWQIDLIDGLEGGRFALVGRMHHALVDGIGALQIVARWLSEQSDRRDQPPIWAAPRRVRPSANRHPSFTSLPQRIEARARSLGALAPLSARVARNAIGGVSSRGWSAPPTPLNTRITARRLLIRRTYKLAHLRELGARADATINDVVLCVCAGALRSYLLAADRLPQRSLTANIPVSIRTRNGAGNGAGNRISWAMVGLGTEIAAPAERLVSIRDATAEAKQRLGEMPGRSIDAYTLLAVTPILAEQLSRVGGRVRPIFNVPISNVPGPRRTLYLDGAELEEIQALTVIYDGYAANLVTLSYCDKIEFAFTVCDEVVAAASSLGPACDEALLALDQALS